jgi:hypothetical protein
VNVNVRVQGGAAAASLGAMPVNADPFTGGGSYTPSAAPPAGAYGAPASSAPAPRALAYCPCRAPVLFESTPAGLEGCGRKLREFSAACADADAALTGGEDATLAALLAALAPGGGAADVAVPAGASELLCKLLSWREGHLFAVLDLCRGAMLLEGAAAALLRADGGDALLGALLRASAGAAVGAAAVVTALRCVANAAAAPPASPARRWALNARDTLLEAFAAAPGCPSKPARAAFTTALLNFGVAATAADGAPDARAAVLSAAVAAAAAVPPEDDDAAFRALVTIGTLALADVGTAASAAQLGAGDVAAAAAGRTGAGAKAPAAAADVTDILRRSGAMA